LDEEDFQLGANVEHAPWPKWTSTPFRAPRRAQIHNPSLQFHEYLPHNCGVAWRAGSAESIHLRKQLLHRMMMGVSNKKISADDQKALRYVMEENAKAKNENGETTSTKNSSLYRLKENTAMAMHSVHKHQYGFYPRFSYIIPPGKVSLLHLYEPSAIHPNFKGDICAFLNSRDDQKRMVWQHTKDSYYDLLLDVDTCQELEESLTIQPWCAFKYKAWECQPLEPYICKESFASLEQ
jgi:hypothetical protein